MANRWICLSDKEINKIKESLDFHVNFGGRKDTERSSLVKKLENSQKTIKVSSRKGKGRSLQQWVCKRISKLLDIPYEQSDDNCLIHSREMGQNGVDVVLRGVAQLRFPFAIETKSVENLSLNAAIRQARNNQKPGIEWMVVFRNKVLKTPVVAMDWDVFERYYAYVLLEEKG